VMNAAHVTAYESTKNATSPPADSGRVCASPMGRDCTCGTVSKSWGCIFNLGSTEVKEKILPPACWSFGRHRDPELRVGGGRRTPMPGAPTMDLPNRGALRRMYEGAHGPYDGRVR
jgi:hypothetical protein